ncbi:MAG: glycosyltransferase [Thermoguttaceae bacterium]|nr:glycosyltransferase [Thermoguttaceae bacterium]
MLWLLVMIIVGHCKDKPFPEPARNLQIAVIICARNEEAVISKLIDSLKAQDYPADSFEVILIAHNCTDKTAEVGRQHGAVVWEAIQTDHPCKGTALTYAIDRIKEEYPDRFDAYCIFDADNIVDPGYLTEINAGLQSGEAQAVLGFRDSVNPNDNWVANMCATHWLVVTRAYNMPRRRLGLSCFVEGTGFAFLKECVEPEGWTAHSITEDFEFSANTILKGKRITHTLRAKFYDEQPTEFDAWLAQLYRWMFGAKKNSHFAGKALANLFPHPVQKMDLFWNATAPLVSGLATLVTTAVFICALISQTPLIPGTDWAFNWILGAGAVIGSYLTMFLMAFLSVVYCGKPIRQYIKGMLTYPFFILAASLLVVISLFYKEYRYKPLIHKGGKSS